MANFNQVVLAGEVRDADFFNGHYSFMLVIFQHNVETHIRCTATEEVTDHLVESIGELNGVSLLVHGRLGADCVLVTLAEVL